MFKGIARLLLLVALGACSEDDGTNSGAVGPLDDPLAYHAWHLNNTGQTAFANRGGIVGMDAKITDVHFAGYSGEGIRIAVSDSGIETSHEDLDENLLDGEHRDYRSLNPPWGKESGDLVGHGTSVSGLIGAIGGNDRGSYGVAYKARMAGFYYVGIAKTTLAKYIDQARGNFDIFNYSYGLYTCKYWSVSGSYISQLKYGVKHYRDGKGALYVKSGGNYNLSPLSHCDDSLVVDNGNVEHFYIGNATLNSSHNYPYQIVVGAFNANGKYSSYSNLGSSLWISAPGGEYGQVNPAMVTTDLTGCYRGYSKHSNYKNSFDRNISDLNSDCQYTSTFGGTSSATPVVSGIIAMMLEANEELNWRDVKYILAKTADQLDASIGDTQHFREDRRLNGHTYLPGWITNKAGFKFHNYYGFGGINAKAAVNMAESYTSSLGTFVETVWTDSGALSSNNTIPDASASGRSDVLAISDDIDLTIEMVQIELSVTHPRISDVGVELTSPGGTKSIIIPINSNIPGSNMSSWILASNAFYGENSEGDWTIKLIDGLSSETGKLTRWKIKFFGY